MPALEGLALGPSHFLLEGVDRLGKDTLLRGIQDRLGYHTVLHYQKPLELACYSSGVESVDALRCYQEVSFQSMFELLRALPNAKIICNRAHLGECVYGSMYRNYSGDYVFDLERRFGAQYLRHVRLVLLVEDFALSQHFVDDGKSLGEPNARREEQPRFHRAFDQSIIPDKRVVCVTDRSTGRFRSQESILDEVLA